MKKIICLSVISLALSLSACGQKEVADVIVYGDSIYTSNAKGDFAEAFAVKDGKYIAVGKKDDVNKYKGDKTKTYESKFVMSGGIESHGHWILNEAFKLGLFIEPFKADGKTAKDFNDIINDIKDYRAKNPTITGIYGYGFNVAYNIVGFDLEVLDREFPDIPVFISESSLHGAIANTKCFKMAGVYDEDKDGILIDRDDSNHPIGICRDEGCTYVRNRVFGALLPQEQYQQAIKNAAKSLNSYGYVIHYDTWSNFDGTDEMYKAINAVDKAGELDILYSSAYCIESFEKDKVDEMIAKAKELKESYTSDHYKPNMIKLFADGVVEVGTGYISGHYNTGENDHGTQIWENEIMASIVNKANSNGLPVHVHTMGDAAAKEAVDAFIDSYNHNGYTRNSIGHVALINNAELRKIKQYGFAVTSGANWASQISDAELEATKAYLDEDVVRKMYPYGEYLDYGIKAALHTDNPCSPGILDIFGYIQVMLNGWDHSKPMDETMFPRRTDSFITVKDAIDMFTINGAWMNNLEKERGSIEIGKYADFIFADKDPFAQSTDDVWKVNLTKTFFEGKQVYDAN